MLSNIKIGYRLAIGFALIIAFTMIVGAVAINGMNRIADNTTKLYEHPYTVSNTVRDIGIRIMAMQSAIKDVLLAQDEAMLRQGMALLERLEVNSERDFEIVFDRYLGDKKEVKELQQGFQAWKTFRKKVLNLRLQGKLSEAIDLLDGEGELQVDQLEDMTQHLISFANNKSEAFLKDAMSAYQTTVFEMIMLLVMMLVIGVFVSMIIARSVTVPLAQIVETMRIITQGDLRQNITIYREDEVGYLANSFRELIDYLKHKAKIADKITQGDLSHRVEVRGDDDQLAQSMNVMIESLRMTTEENKNQNWIKTGQSELGHVVRGDIEVSSLSQYIISFLANYLQCQMGAFYRVPVDSKKLKLSAGFAMHKQHDFHPEFQFGQGLVGQAALEKKLLVVANIPEDYACINSSIGETLPRHLVVVPLLINDVVVGVIELASLTEFGALSIEFLESIDESIAIAINSADARSRMKQLLAKSERQAELLQTQQEELQSSNEELEEQTRSLLVSEGKLKAQQEELQVTNEELEEQASSLFGSEERLKQQQKELQAANDELKIKSKSLAQQNREIITAGNRLEVKAQELTQASRYKSEFLANMSHELRTPLNSLLLLARILSDNEEENLTKEQVESATIIYNSGNDLLNLISDILDISKIEAGQMGIAVAAVRMGELAERMKQTFSHLCSEKGLTLNFKFANDLPELIYSDVRRLDQIVKNLISNAIKFTDTGSVTLEFRQPEPNHPFVDDRLAAAECIVLIVRDTGIGIPAEKCNMIFEAFKQADGNTTRLYGGSGLGLSISKELVRLLGGEMVLKSEVDKGSSFMLYLPIKLDYDDTQNIVKPMQRDIQHVATDESEMEDNKLLQHDPLHDDRAQIQSGERAILLVEDDLNFAKIVLKQCREAGFKGIATDHGRAGLLLAREHQPNAIILDLDLPGMSGLQLLDCLKAEAETRHIPIHIVSVTEPDSNTIKRGAMGFLQKPVSKQQLNEVFESVAYLTNKGVKDLLLIEDDTNVQQAIIKLIGNGDVKITTVANGEAAFTAIKKGQFDCMILDLGLPDMSGFELLTRLRNYKQMTIPPVIVYTGRDLSREEADKLREFSQSIIIKGVRSEERLLDETALFLHRIVGNLSEQKQAMIRNLHEKDALFQGKRIMIVDDDMRNLFALSKLLRDRGMTVIKAQNGQKCLELLDTTEEIDLILMDIMMPEMDGYETMTRIRLHRKYASLPMIALTAKAMANDREKCVAAGASDYLPKPLDMNRLLSMLRVWLYQ